MENEIFNLDSKIEELNKKIEICEVNIENIRNRLVFRLKEIVDLKRNKHLHVQDLIKYQQEKIEDETIWLITLEENESEIRKEKYELIRCRENKLEEFLA